MNEEQQPRPAFWAELRRHPGFQAAVVFAGGSWLLLQAADIFGLATATVRLIGMLLVGVLVILAGWSFVSVLRGQARAVVPRARARTVIVATAVLLVLGTGAWFARPYMVPPLRAGSEVIAVLPFNATGTGVEVLGEGLVDLLSANLNEAGVLRTIHPRTTLHQFEQVAREGSIDLEGQLRVGRNVGAGSILVGSLVSTGTEVRITAELYSVDTGEVIANAQGNGAPDNVLALVDQVSIQLMQDIWRARTPIPELRVSAITTQSIPAIKAYMRGEQFYRRVQWDSAQAAFEEAIRHDSTFALAHFRLGETYGWRENLGSEGAREHSDKAARFADRLPTPVRKLIVAHQLHEQGVIDAIDSLQAYVSQYPDDVGGHYLLADARSHAGAVLGLDLETMLDGFERVYAMDPTFAPNYAHLLELTLLTGDTARYGRYLNSLRDLLPEEVVMYEMVRDIRWGERDAALAVAGTALRTTGSRRVQYITRVINTTSARAFAPNSDVDFMLAMLDSLEAAAGEMPQVSRQAPMTRVGLYGTTGRLREAEEIVAGLRRQSPDQALNAAILLIVSGLAPETVFQLERERLEVASTRPFAAYWAAVGALSENDTMAAQRHLATIARDTAHEFVQPQMIGALDGWMTAARGDTLAGIAQMRNALLDLGYEPGRNGITGMLRLQMAMLQVTQPEWRAEGIRRLELVTRQEGLMTSLVAIPLAETYLAEGRSEDAKAMYARFLDLWRNADPEMQPRVESVENALLRITAERAAT